MTEDVSTGGCFLQAVEKLPTGSKINLVFQLPGSSRYIEAVGEVKHLREDGMGIEFVAMDQEGTEETERFIRSFVQYQKEDDG